VVDNVKVLGHQRLISLLLPVLQATSRANPTAPSRLITLASAAHSTAPTGGVDYESLKKGGKVLERWIEYGESKWGDIALAKWVDAHHGPKSGSTGGEVLACAVHPGLVSTPLYTHVSAASLLPYLPWVHAMINVTAKDGALAQLWAAEVPVHKARELSGGYVAPYESKITHRPDLTVEAAEKVWEWCEQQARRTD
jgi:retinol dehydrogenase-12